MPRGLIEVPGRFMDLAQFDPQQRVIRLDAQRAFDAADGQLRITARGLAVGLGDERRRRGPRWNWRVAAGGGATAGGARRRRYWSRGRGGIRRGHGCGRGRAPDAPAGACRDLDGLAEHHATAQLHGRP